MFAEKYGPWALVVGGSEGVGAHFALKLARRGLNLVLVARKPGPLEDVATQCREAGVQVRAVQADVSQPAEALAAARRQTDDIEVGLLVYMAGANTGRGAFTELPYEKVQAVVAMNVDGQLMFTHHYAGLMKQRGRGGVILVGSIASYVGTPLIAHYSAAKAFSRIFSEALWYEMAPAGVDVLHLSLNFTATPAMARLGYDLSAADDPEAIAEEGLAHIADGPVWDAGGEANRAESLRRATQMPRSAAVASVSLPPVS